MPDLSSCKIVLNQEFIDRITDFVLSNRGYEVGGWIFGRYEKDLIYVMVAERDMNAEESAGGLRVRSIAPLNEFPDLEVVGYWHTHPAGFASFSGTDRSTMENWIHAVTVSDIPKLKQKIYLIASMSREGVDWAFFTPEIEVDMQISELQKNDITLGKIREFFREEYLESIEEFKGIQNLGSMEDIKLDFYEIEEKIYQIINSGEEKGILVLKPLEKQSVQINAAPYISLFRDEYSYDEVVGIWLKSHWIDFTSVEKAFLLNFSRKIGMTKFLVIKDLEDECFFREVEIKSEKSKVEIVKIPEEAIEIIPSPDKQQEKENNSS